VIFMAAHRARHADSRRALQPRPRLVTAEMPRGCCGVSRARFRRWTGLRDRPRLWNALVAVTFLWQLVGSLLDAPSWLADPKPFAHVGLVPTQSFRLGTAVAMLAIGALSALAAIGIFRRRDPLGA
jgi:hypothetical protein